MSATTYVTCDECRVRHLRVDNIEDIAIEAPRFGWIFNGRLVCPRCQRAEAPTIVCRACGLCTEDPNPGRAPRMPTLCATCQADIDRLEEEARIRILFYLASSEAPDPDRLAWRDLIPVTPPTIDEAGHEYATLAVAAYLTDLGGAWPYVSIDTGLFTTRAPIATLDGEFDLAELTRAAIAAYLEWQRNTVTGQAGSTTPGCRYLNVTPNVQVGSAPVLIQQDDNEDS